MFELYKNYKNDFFNNTIKHLNITGLSLKRVEKLGCIHEAYQDIELLSYLLYDYEIEFLKKNLNNNNIELNYITYQLEKLLILIKVNGALRVNDYIKKDIIKGIEYYDTCKVEIDNTKYLIYFALGIIRTKGIVLKSYLRQAFKDCFHLSDIQIEDVLLLMNEHPLLNRFVKPKKLKSKLYYCLFEFLDDDFEILNYESKNTEINSLSLINIGKYYLDTESNEYLEAINNLNNAIYLSRCDRALLIYLSGFAKFKYYNTHHLIDNNTKKLLDLDTNTDILDYLELLPSYYPCGKKSVFIDSSKVRGMFKAYIAYLYFNYKKDYMADSNTIQSVDEKHLLSLVHNHEADIEKIRENKPRDYYVYKFLSDKIVLLDIELKKLVYMKTNIYSLILNTYSTGRVVNQNLIDVDGDLTPIINNSISFIDDEKKVEYDSICEKLMKN